MNIISTRARALSAVSVLVNLMWAGAAGAKIDADTVVGAWLFDEGEGDVVADASDTGNDGRIMVAPNWVEGNIGGAVEFDGARSYVEVSHHASLQITDTVSISVWIKRTRIGVDLILEKGGDWTQGSTNYGLGVHTVNDRMYYFFFTGGWRGTPSPDDLDWHHYAVVATAGDMNPTLYIDADEVPVETGDGVENMIFSETEKPLNIGAQIDPVATIISRNIMDELVILNAALSDDDVAALMERGFEDALSVAPSGKLTTTWGSIK